MRYWEVLMKFGWCDYWLMNMRFEECDFNNHWSQGKSLNPPFSPSNFWRTLSYAPYPPRWVKTTYLGNHLRTCILGHSFSWFQFVCYQRRSISREQCRRWMQLRTEWDKHGNIWFLQHCMNPSAAELGHFYSEIGGGTAH